MTSARNLKHAVYDEKGKQEVAKYVSTAVSKFKPSFPIFSESMVYPQVKNYKENLKEKAKQGQRLAIIDFTPAIGNARGQPLLLDEELNLKLCAMIITLQTTGPGINGHVVRDVLNGLVCANPERFGRYIRSAVVYHRMKFSG